MKIVEALVITLREGMEAALVVGLILAYLGRTGRAHLNSHVYWGLLLAVLASLAGAAGFRLLGIDPENEVLEGTLYAVAAVLVASLVIWMWRASRNVKRDVETRLEALTGEAGWRQGWGLLAFSFFMVFREGVEMVLFFQALSITAADPLLQLIGGITGLALAALFGFLLIRGSIRLDLQRFFGLTGLVLLILVARLVAQSLHEFFEVGVLPSSPGLLAVIGFIVKDSSSIVVLIALVLLPALAMLPGLRRRPEKAAQPEEGPAERRKRVAALQHARYWQMAVIALTVAVVLPLAWQVYAAEVAAYRPQPVAITPQGDEVRIAIGALELSRLNKYLYHGLQGDVRFMVIKRAEEDLAVALDRCEICPPVGFYQEGDTLICDNCNAPVSLDSVGLPGGCNPVPLVFAQDGDSVVIPLRELDAAQARFAMLPRGHGRAFSRFVSMSWNGSLLATPEGAYCPLAGPAASRARDK